MSTVNLSSAAKWEYPLKTLPRPTGRGTRMIVTEYDLPRKTIEPHDVIVDSQGMAWYSNFGEQTIGKLDPKTGKVTEYPVPITKEGWPTGNLALRFDKDQNMWIGLMLQGAIAKFDRKTEEFQTWKLPPEWNNDATQVNMVSPERYSVDGKVWLENHGYTMILRMDLKSGKFEPFEPFKGAFEKGENHNIYDVVPDSHNNAYFTDFEQGQIGRIDAKTGKITFLSHADAVLPAAPGLDGCTRPILVCGISRQPDRHVRYANRTFPGVGGAKPMEHALRRGHGQHRSSVDRFGHQ